MDRRKKILTQDILRIQKHILDGDQRSFPRAYFYEAANIYGEEMAKECFVECLKKHMIEEQGIKEKDLYLNLTKEAICKAKLYVGYEALFENKRENLFMFMFPDKEIWHMPKPPAYLWTNEEKARFSKWLIEEHLGLNEDNVLQEIDTEKLFETDEDGNYLDPNAVIVKNRVRGINVLINLAYPNLSRDYIKTVIKSRTTARNGVKRRERKEAAMKMMADIKPMKEETIDDTLKIYKYILEGKQGGFPPAYFSKFMKNDETLAKESLIACFKYYLKNILNIPDEEMYKNVSFKNIRAAKLLSALRDVYDKKTHLLFKDMYPERPIWDMEPIPTSFWNDENAKEFSKWFIEEHLGLNEDNVLDEIDTKSLCKIGDDGNIIDKYGRLIRNKIGSIANCINLAYPDYDKEYIKRKIKSRTTTLAHAKRREREMSEI